MTCKRNIRLAQKIGDTVYVGCLAGFTKGSTAHRTKRRQVRSPAKSITGSISEKAKQGDTSHPSPGGPWVITCLQLASQIEKLPVWKARALHIFRHGCFQATGNKYSLTRTRNFLFLKCFYLQLERFLLQLCPISFPPRQNLPELPVPRNPLRHTQAG